MTTNESKLLLRVRRTIANSDELVFLQSDFAGYGSDEQVGRAMARLIDGGALVQIGEGLLAKARKNRITGQTMLDASGGFDEVAKAGLEKLGIAWEPGDAEAAYQSGATQIPAKTVVRIKTSDTMPRIAYGRYQLLIEPL
ncbi:hypothetical protein [Marinobacter sp. NFXS9]|uniref:hypothetical protein n=1 Tax=Marinobacter sp. NFXS9 TaxID=2818433 RepID=UPI0032DF72C6